MIMKIINATADAKNKDNVISICIIARNFEENSIIYKIIAFLLF